MARFYDINFKKLCEEFLSFAFLLMSSSTFSHPDKYSKTTDKIHITIIDKD